MAAHLIDRSGRTYPWDDLRWRGDDGSPLMASELPGMTRGDVDRGVRSQWRYAAALPHAIPAPVSMGEGCTPLLEVTLEGLALRVKPEWVNPTASFKDRGVSVMVSALLRAGVPAVLEDSSGNGGSSVAAYAAAAAVRATILAPEGTSEAKLMQSRAHGAEVELVPGSRSDTADEAVRRVEAPDPVGDAEGGGERPAYASHNWHPMFLQGLKLLAYEIWEDLGFRAPDAVVVPAGAGSLVLGCHLGFAELLRSGEIGRLPRLIAVQPENCGPLAAAFGAGRDDVPGSASDASPGREGGRAQGDGRQGRGTAGWRPTIAEGTAIARPVRAREVLAAVRASGGTLTTVSERRIALATRTLARRGLYAEPTSAVAAAAIPRLAGDGHLRTGEVTVLVLTGSALKAPEAMRRALTLS